MLIKCDFFRAGVTYQFRSVAEYFLRAEADLQDDYHAERSKIILDNKLPPNISEEEFQEWSAENQTKIDACDLRFATTFRSILRFSFVILIYTLVESNLSAIARQIARRKQLTLEVLPMRWARFALFLR